MVRSRLLGSLVCIESGQYRRPNSLHDEPVLLATFKKNKKTFKFLFTFQSSFRRVEVGGGRSQIRVRGWASEPLAEV
jgi:hypothetical protein